MTTLWFSRRARADLDRFFRFLEDADVAEAEVALELIEDALSSLRRHPYLGRPVTRGLRELLISRGRSGYVALYSFDAARDEVTVHALRHQKEAGYSTN